VGTPECHPAHHTEDLFLNFNIDFSHKGVCIEKKDIDFYTFRESIKSFDYTKVM